MATQTILDGTAAVSPAFTFDRWGQASVTVSGATDSNVVVMEARPVGDSSADWVPLRAGTWDAPEVRELRVDAGLSYRFRSAAAGPVAKVTTQLGVLT